MAQILGDKETCTKLDGEVFGLQVKNDDDDEDRT